MIFRKYNIPSQHEIAYPNNTHLGLGLFFFLHLVIMMVKHHKGKLKIIVDNVVKKGVG